MVYIIRYATKSGRHRWGYYNSTLPRDEAEAECQEYFGDRLICFDSLPPCRFINKLFPKPQYSIFNKYGMTFPGYGMGAML